MGRRIGFFGSKDEGATEDIEKLEDLQQRLVRDYRSVEEIESQLIQELEEIRHLETNIRTIEEHVKAIRSLAEQRKRLYEALFGESEKAPTEIETARCFQYIEMIRAIDEKLMPMLNYLGNELSRYKIDDTHKLYAKFSEEKDRFKKIHDDSARLCLELSAIREMVRSSSEHVQRMHRRLRLLEDQRKSKPKDGAIGFKQ